MPADQSLQLLHQIPDELTENTTTTNLVFAARSSGHPPTFSIRYVQLHNRLIGDLKSISTRATELASECQFIPYDPSYKPDPQECMYIKLDSNSSVKNFVDSMLNIAGLDTMTDDADYYKNISLYGIVHKVSGHDLLVLRSMSPQNVLKRSRKLGIFFQSGIYDRLETGVLLLDREIDCFAFNGYMYILNVSGFHRLSQYHEEVITAATDVITDAALRIPILNLDAFEDIGTKDYRMAAKLASIKNKPYLSTLTLDKVRQVIKQHNLPIAIQIDKDGIEKLVFDPDPQKRFLILKVLDDDYLHSDMTEQNYAVNSKVPSTA
jgi:hypothetical protein